MGSHVTSSTRAVHRAAGTVAVQCVGLPHHVVYRHKAHTAARWCKARHFVAPFYSTEVLKTVPICTAKASWDKYTTL